MVTDASACCHRVTTELTRLHNNCNQVCLHLASAGLSLPVFNAAGWLAGLLVGNASCPRASRVLLHRVIEWIILTERAVSHFMH
jgi:hypothetical protein